VQRLAVNYGYRERLHSDAFRPGNAPGLLAVRQRFDLVAARIKGWRDLLLGGTTERAASVERPSIAHGIFL